MLASPSLAIASTETPNSLTGNVSVYNKIDTNEDGEIQVSEALLIKYLNLLSLNISNLDGINAFTNLIVLNCDSNQLTNLNMSGLTHLEKLNCSDNQLTSLNFIGLTNLKDINCASNQITNLNLSGLTNLQILVCSNNQLPNLNVSGLTNLQIFYCDVNQLTSLDVSGLSNLQYLKCTYNFLTTLFIKNNNLIWEELSFSNNPNLAYICANESDISLVQQRINTYGYTNCNVNSYCSFNPGGTFYTIQGNDKFDNDGNGCNTSDSSFPNLKFNITNGTISGNLISNASGNYSIPVSAGTHTITPQFENSTYFTASPSSATVTFPTASSPFIQNFCVTPVGVHHDLEAVVIPVNVARPGFDAKYKIKYKNKGTTSEVALVNFNYNDAILDYVTTSVAPTTQATGTLTWNVGTLTPFQSGEFLVTLNVNSPTETPPVNGGVILNYTATASGLNTDETPDDNTFSLAQVVVNSFDPNDKTCLEGSTMNPSRIGKYVHYKVRFENTGTFSAQNIVVKDIIDNTKFDIATLQMTDASHSCITRITNPDKVEFIFENINLPFDDANNDGYVVFKIKTKSTLVLGNSFSNSANIYFDYNFPIVTNNYTTTIQNSLGTSQFEIDNLTIFPNPVKDILQFKTIEKVLKIEVYDITGRILSSNSVNENKVDLTELKTGNYILKVYTENAITNTKIIKE